MLLASVHHKYSLHIHYLPLFNSCYCARYRIVQNQTRSDQLCSEMALCESSNLSHLQSLSAKLFPLRRSQLAKAKVFCVIRYTTSCRDAIISQDFGARP